MLGLHQRSVERSVVDMIDYMEEMFGLHRRSVVEHMIDFVAATMVPKLPEDAAVYISIL
jgi:hypothetical protein